MQLPLELLPVENSDSMPWYFFAAFGGVFAVVGTLLVFGRSGVILDRRKGVIVQWRGLLVPMKEKEQALDETRRVWIRKNSGGDSADSYPVTLEGDNLPPVRLLSPTDYQEARGAAEELAKFLTRPVVDISSGIKVVGRPDELDQSLGKRFQASGEAFSMPDPPWNMRSKVREMDDGVILEIPSHTITLPRWARWGAGLVFGGAAFYFFTRFMELPAPGPIRYVFIGFFIVFFLLAPLVKLLQRIRRDSREPVVVAATTSFLRVEEGRKGKRKVTEIPANELEELELPTRETLSNTIEIPGKFSSYPLPDTGIPRLPDGRPMPRFLASLMRLVPSPGIVARSDRASVQFGAGLSEDELRYLHALIRKALSKNDETRS